MKYESTKGEPMKESLDWTAEEVESHERWRKSWRGRLFFLRFDLINFMRYPLSRVTRRAYRARHVQTDTP